MRHNVFYTFKKKNLSIYRIWNNTDEQHLKMWDMEPQKAHAKVTFVRRALRWFPTKPKTAKGIVFGPAVTMNATQ